MTKEAFQTLVSQEPALAGPIQHGGRGRSAGGAWYDDRTSRHRTLVSTRLVRRAADRLALAPRSQTFRRAVALEVSRWIDGMARKSPLDPDQAEKGPRHAPR
jgi:hypothetical protein